MKTRTIAFLLLSLLSFSAFSSEEVEPLVVKKPSALEEGIQRQLTDAQIAELLPWAKDSKVYLVDLLDSLQSLNMQDKIERLDSGIKQVVTESAPKNSELLMRYILNRAIVLKNTLAQEMSEDAVGTADAKLRVLTTSINLAIKYYDTDMKTLAKTGTPDFTVFGYDYFQFLHELNKSIFDASAQFYIQKTALEWLQWDLYRALNNKEHAPKISKINRSLKMITQTNQTDAQYIRNIQNLKKIVAQLELAEKVVPSNPHEGSALKIIDSYEKMKKRFAYSTQYQKCYTRSSTGDIMYGNPVDNQYCEEPNNFRYSTQYQKCYSVSYAGDVMYSSIKSNLSCAKPDSFYYSTQYQKCYAKSNNDDVMYANVVSNDKCAAPDKFLYSSNKCYAVSKAGDIMYSSIMSNEKCMNYKD